MVIYIGEEAVDGEKEETEDQRVSGRTEGSSPTESSSVEQSESGESESAVAKKSSRSMVTGFRGCSE